jgi:hypothetical protein
MIDVYVMSDNNQIGYEYMKDTPVSILTDEMLKYLKEHESEYYSWTWSLGVINPYYPNGTVRGINFKMW